MEGQFRHHRLASQIADQTDDELLPGHVVVGAEVGDAVHVRAAKNAGIVHGADVVFGPVGLRVREGIVRQDGDGDLGLGFTCSTGDDSRSGDVDRIGGEETFFIHHADGTVTGPDKAGVGSVDRVCREGGFCGERQGLPAYEGLRDFPLFCRDGDGIGTFQHPDGHTAGGGLAFHGHSGIAGNLGGEDALFQNAAFGGVSNDFRHGSGHIICVRCGDGQRYLSAGQSHGIMGIGEEHGGLPGLRLGAGQEQEVGTFAEGPFVGGVDGLGGSHARVQCPDGRGAAAV